MLQGVVEMLEFVVDGDPQSLENSGGGVDGAPFAGNAPPDDLGQPPGGLDPLGFPLLDDPPSDPPAVAFLPEMVKDVRQFLGREPVHQVGGRVVGVGVEPHVKRAVG